jgi:hypothetical protein
MIWRILAFCLAVAVLTAFAGVAGQPVVAGYQDGNQGKGQGPDGDGPPGNTGPGNQGNDKDSGNAGGHGGDNGNGNGNGNGYGGDDDRSPPDRDHEGEDCRNVNPSADCRKPDEVGLEWIWDGSCVFPWLTSGTLLCPDEES